MKNLLNRFNLFSIVLFFYSCAFVVLDGLPHAPHYDTQAYERLKAFGAGENIENNLFENANFRGIILEDSRLNKIILQGVKLNHSHFSNSRFRKKSKLLNSNFKDVQFKSILFNKSLFEASEFYNAKFIDSVLNNLIIRGSKFEKTKFENCRFSNMRTDAKECKKCFIYDNNFNSSSFKFCAFKWVGLRDNTFLGSRFERTTFNKCIIVGADFEGAFFENVLFEKCIFFDCKNFDEVFFGKNVTFNFCEFAKTNQKRNYERKLIYCIENLGVSVVRKPDVWAKFKYVAGPIIGIFATSCINFVSGAAIQYANLVLSACNQSCAVWLAQNQQSSCPIQCVGSNN